jgi:hypothetical protein
MLQAITTKYLPTTRTRHARIKATCQAGTATIVVYDDWLSQQHYEAAWKLATELGWLGESDFSLVGGANKDGTFTFVLVNESTLRACNEDFNRWHRGKPVAAG